MVNNCYIGALETINKRPWLQMARIEMKFIFFKLFSQLLVKAKWSSLFQEVFFRFSGVNFNFNNLSLTRQRNTVSTEISCFHDYGQQLALSLETIAKSDRSKEILTKQTK